MNGIVMKDGDHIRVAGPDIGEIQGEYICTLVDGKGAPGVMLDVARDPGQRAPVITVMIQPEDEWTVLPS